MSAVAKSFRQPVPCTQCSQQLMRRLYRTGGQALERFFCDAACRTTWRREHLRPSRDVLYALYVEQRQTCPEIARQFGCDPTTIRHWLVEARIPTRPRGTYAPAHFKKGQAPWNTGRRHPPETVAKIRATTIARGGVPYLRGGKHYLAGARSEANPNWRGGLTPERQAFYRSAEWKAACIAVWHRADAKCERCGLDHRNRLRDGGGKFHVHHIVTFQYPPLRAEPSNLALLCPDCHRFVHGRDNALSEFIRPRPDGDVRAAAEAVPAPDLFDLLAAEGALPEAAE